MPYFPDVVLNYRGMWESQKRIQAEAVLDD